MAGRARPVASLLRVPVLQRHGGDRAARRLSSAGSGPARRVEAGTPVRPLPDGGALRRLAGGRGARGPGAADYASGQDLFGDGQWEWLIAASYADYALIEPERVTIVHPAEYEIRDREYRLVGNPTIPRDVVRAALHEMSRFYR